MKTKNYYKSLVDTINEPKECVEVAYAIQILAWHNKNLLSNNLADDYERHIVVLELLKKAINGD